MFIANYIEEDFVGEVINVTLPHSRGGTVQQVDVNIIIDDDIAELQQTLVGYIEIVAAVDTDTKWAVCLLGHLHTCQPRKLKLLEILLDIITAVLDFRNY